MTDVPEEPRTTDAEAFGKKKGMSGWTKFGLAVAALLAALIGTELYAPGKMMSFLASSPVPLTTLTARPVSPPPSAVFARGWSCDQIEPHFQAVLKLRQGVSQPILAGVLCHEKKPASLVLINGFGPEIGFANLDEAVTFVARARAAVTVPQRNVVAFVGLSDDVFTKMLGFKNLAEAGNNTTFSAWVGQSQLQRDAVTYLRNIGVTTSEKVAKVYAGVKTGETKKS